MKNTPHDTFIKTFLKDKTIIIKKPIIFSNNLEILIIAVFNINFFFKLITKLIKIILL
jgi:hypothetical protein